jgi:2-amino-4-hydroxy-6-hydroxymethyldihydropteridine diphosphokinase
MARAFLGLGSNQDREASLRGAVVHLSGLGPLRLSAVYESAAVGFDGAPFLNLVAELVTELPVRDLHGRLRAIEEALGRRREHHGYAPRPIDLDLLLYDDLILREDGLELPSGDLERYAFVARPLAELAPELVHPVLGVTAGALAASHAGAALRPVDLAFEGFS